MSQSERFGCINTRKWAILQKKPERSMVYLCLRKKRRSIWKILRRKYEIAEELGLLERVMENGWKSLSAKETGRIGGLMTKRKKQMRAEAMEQ